MNTQLHDALSARRKMPGYRFQTYWPILMQDAAMNARRVLEIEAAGPYPPPPAELAWHRSCAVSGIVLAASALEAFANEVFLSPSHQSDGYPFSAEARAKIRAQWAPPKPAKGEKAVKAIERMQPLAKLDVALDCGGKPMFPHGHGTPYKESSLALDLRNAFVHSKIRTTPTLDLAHDPHEPLERALAQCTFAAAPYYPKDEGVTVFPYHCYGHACVEWAITSHLTVMRHVAAELWLDQFSLSGQPWDFKTR
jgi:hypothetical protein